MVPVAKGSRQDTDLGLLPSERASKIIRVRILDHSFDGLGPEISWVKGCPGLQSGGWGPGQSGVPWSRGGECFAPFKLRIRDVGSPELLAGPCLIPELGSLAISFRCDGHILSTSRLKHLRAINMFASIWHAIFPGPIITLRA